MDIGHAQKVYDLEGRVDRVDLILSDEAGFYPPMGKRVPLQSARQRSETFSGMLQAFRLNLEALSLLALFVGVFLIYTTAMFTVSAAAATPEFEKPRLQTGWKSSGPPLGDPHPGHDRWSPRGLMGFLLTRFLTSLTRRQASQPLLLSAAGTCRLVRLDSHPGVVLGCVPVSWEGLSLADLIRTDPVKHERPCCRPRECLERPEAALAALLILLASLASFFSPGTHVYVGLAASSGCPRVSLLTGVVLVALHP